MDSQDLFSNTVSATLTWQGNSPAPAVIAEEDAVASWYIDGDGTGTCTCGLPNDTYIGYYQDGYDFATQYTGHSGGTTLPAVTSSGATTLANGLETDNFVNLSYTVTPYPVTMKLDGTTPDSNGIPNILVGQGCTASLVGIPSKLLPSTTYAWSVSDPNGTFQSWNGGGTISPVVAILGLGPTNQPTAHWFWTDTAGSKR